MREERSYVIVVACFAAGLYLAVLVAAFGVISLATDTEVIPDPAAGPLVGPIMVAVAVGVFLVLLILTGIRVPGEQQRIAPLNALGAGLACYLAYCLSGGVAGALATGDALRFALFAVSRFASLYAIAVAVVAFLIMLLYQLVLVGRFRQRGRPRWPWERPDDE
ncbi:hypothetical protein ASF88_02790 [Leifsonia sp. Leaf336]|uniref:DUF6121 family protein n=1 Tax=Leifsonia sp. Leaf336 TaxID=1736341 RepID=UPI0006FDCFFD|nr:DUF6121 family protein [Leifsonia sp. Leaf336]KQR53795.1 hypothetical protein ASF88_02790 [Leifsonia sp. Leaf336]